MHTVLLMLSVTTLPMMSYPALLHPVVTVEDLIVPPAISQLLPETAVSAHQQTATVLAQQFDQDILGDLTAAFRTFIDSGQLWALLIGIVIGYLIRSITTYS